LGRAKAYLIIAIIGFFIGYGLYYLGRFAAQLFEEYVFSSLSHIFVNPETFHAVLSGIAGMIVAVVLAYIWARSE